MEKIKSKLKNIKLQDVLCLFIILCPFLDMASFLFRNALNTSISPSTFLRPIIPIIVIAIIFFKNKIKGKLLLGFLVYAVYAGIHLILFYYVKTQSSYSGIIHEAQYLVNYSFMILNLFLYVFLFSKEEGTKLKKSILVAVSIYVFSMFISIFTGTSSSTYVEGMGYKGWFESGNSISAILILSLFILFTFFRTQKKYRYYLIALMAFMGIYLTTLIGTRVGLFGFVLVIFTYLVAEVFVTLLHKSNISKKLIVGGLCSILIVGIVVGIVGSNTLERRKHLKEMEGSILDPKTGQVAHLTGDLIHIKEQIEQGTITEEYMSKAAQKSILELYQYANEKEISNSDMRQIQLVYNVCLVKNQASIPLLLFGNGYMANFVELVMEMEIPAFLFNFGWIGFVLYLVPFLGIAFYGIWIGIKNLMKIDVEYIMLLTGSIFTFALSFFSGYTFFNSSTMMIVIVINTLLIGKIQKLRGEELLRK